MQMQMQMQGVVSVGVAPVPDLSEEDEDAACGAGGAGGRDFISLRKRKKLNTIVPNPRKPRTADYMCANCGEVCTTRHFLSTEHCPFLPFFYPSFLYSFFFFPSSLHSIFFFYFHPSFFSPFILFFPLFIIFLNMDTNINTNEYELCRCMKWWSWTIHGGLFTVSSALSASNSRQDTIFPTLFMLVCLFFCLAGCLASYLAG